MEKSWLSPPGARAGRREWTGLVVLALPTLVVALDIGALFLALPQLTADLGASSIEQLWITDIYGFMTAGFLITMGTLGDRVGRRRLLMIGAAAFGVASVLAAFSTSAVMLIAARALLGVAGATLGPSTLALISNMFRDPKQRGVAIAAWVTCLMAGAALSPVVGGVMLERFWWGSVFLLAVPVMGLLLLVGPALLPEYLDADAGRLDLTSVALSLVAVLPIVYGLKELAAGASTSLVAGAVLIGAGAAAAFVRRQNRLADPLLDLRLFRSPVLRATLVIMLVGGATIGGTFLLVSQYVQTVEQLPAAQAGLWLTPAAISLALGAMLTPLIARRVPAGRLIGAGLIISAAGFGLLSLLNSGGGLAVAVSGIALVHLGAGPMMALGTDLVVGSAPPEKAGSAASMTETVNYLGTSQGLAALGTIGTTIYRGELADVLPAGLAEATAQTARETLAGAAVAAQQLPAGPAAELLEAARHAFTTGLGVAAAGGAVLFVGLAVLAAAVLRPAAGVAQPATPEESASPVR